MNLAFFTKKVIFLALSVFAMASGSFATQTDIAVKRPSISSLHDLTAFVNTPQRKKVILWDLGFVLLKPNPLKMSTQYILPKTCGWNPWNLVRLALLWKKGCLTSKGIQSTMDAVLHHARRHEERQTMVVNQHGEPHENIDCDYQSGTKTDAELWNEIQQSILELDEADKQKTDANDRIFKNPAHRYIVEKTLQMRFAAPQFFGESFNPIAQGVELLEKCVKAGHEMAILSNWGAQSFPYLQNSASTQAIFKHIKPANVFVSGNIHLSKPHREAYDLVLARMKIQPEDVIFIDDQIKNVEAARAVGMHAIHVADYKNPQTYQKVEAELKALDVL